MYLTLISIITLQVFSFVLVHTFWNIVDNILIGWYAAFIHILTLIVLVSSIVWNLRNSSAISLRNLKSVGGPLWPISLIGFMILMTRMNLRNRPLTATLFNSLIFGCTTIELLDRGVLLESPYILSLPVLGRIGWSDSGCGSTFVDWNILRCSIQAVLVGETRWGHFQGVLRAVLLLFIHSVPYILNLSRK